MDHLVGLGLGSTWCDVTVRRRPESSGLGGTVPATLAFRPDGSVVVGEAAEEYAGSYPGDVLRDFVRRVGDRTPIVVGGRTLTAADAVALFVNGVVAELGGRLGPPTQIALAHPVSWTGVAVARLLAALNAQGLRGVLPVPAPLAAVAAKDGLRGPVAIVDVSTDLAVSVVNVSDRQTAALLGPPVTVPHLAGPVWDDFVLAQVRSALGETWARFDPADVRVRIAMAELRRRCTQAKMRLSTSGVADVEVELPGVRARVSLDRERFESLVGAALAEVVVAFGSALVTAAVGPTELSDVLLIGDSAPLVAPMLSKALGRPVVADPAPLAAIGAADLREAACSPTVAPRREARVPGPRHALHPDSTRQVAGSATWAVSHVRSLGAAKPAEDLPSGPRHSVTRPRREYSRPWPQSWSPAAVSRHSTRATG